MKSQPLRRPWVSAKVGSVHPWRESKVKQADNLVQNPEEDKIVKEWAKE